MYPNERVEDTIPDTTPTRALDVVSSSPPTTDLWRLILTQLLYTTGRNFKAVTHFAMLSMSA